VLLAVCILLTAGIYRRRNKNNVEMPDVLGMTVEQAAAELAQAGIQAGFVSAYSEQYAEGRIMLQSVAGGETLRIDSSVTLTVSLGSQWYFLEDYTGWNAPEAYEDAVQAGAKQVEQVYVESDLPVGCIVYVDQPSGWTSRDTVVTFSVSGQIVAVPDLTGMTVGGVQAVLEAEGLILGNVSESDNPDAPSGSVIYQSVAPSTRVLVGTSVDITVCRSQVIWYAPPSALTLMVPLNNLNVVIDLVTPSGQSVEAFAEILPSGTHRVEMHSQEMGIHKVYIYMDDVLMESLQLNFE